MTTEYERNVLAHVQAHEAKGETAAVKAHMASPKHKAVVDAAEAVVAPPAKTGGKGGGKGQGDGENKQK